MKTKSYFGKFKSETSVNESFDYKITKPALTVQKYTY